MVNLIFQINNVIDLKRFQPLMLHPNGISAFEVAAGFNTLDFGMNNIDTAAGQAARIVKALRNFSRKGADEQIVLADIVEGLDTVLILFHSQMKEGIKLIRKLDNVPHIYCLPEALNQVWTNLLKNALQAMKFSGVLEISSTTTDDGITISFLDDGPGIPNDKLEEIFSPFVTTKSLGEGTGLGLSIVQEIIKKHGGEISVKNM